MEEPMAARQIIAILLIVAGVLALVYGSFSYTKETHEAKIGPLQFSIKEKETVNVPVWAGIGAIGIGVILLVVGRK
jgi:drug/metabolite transporter (DMT)-like permease